MCIIVDTNKLGGFLGEPPASESEPIHRWLDKGWGRIVYSTGGKFQTELQPAAQRKLLTYAQRGDARLIPGIDREVQALQKQGGLKSDDPHIIALARVSGARLLYTADAALIADFKNSALIKPRGKVYSGPHNKKLLTQRACPRTP